MFKKFKEKLVEIGDNLKDNKHQYVYLALILFNQLAYGMSEKILNPAETDLGIIYGVPALTIDNFFIPIYAAYLIGSLANYLHRWLNRQLLVAVCVLMPAITYAMLPHYGSLEVAHFAMVLHGIGKGVWKCGSSIWMIEILPDHIPVVLQAGQFMYNVGATLGPRLAYPFVWGNKTEDAYNNTLTVQDRQRSLAIPFMIYGYCQAIVPIVFLVLYCMKPFKAKAQHHHAFSPKSVDDLEVSHHENGHNGVNGLNGHGHNNGLNGLNGQNGHPQTIINNVSHKEHEPGHHDPSAIPNRTYKMILCGFAIATYYTAEIAYLQFYPDLFRDLGLTDPEISQAYADIVIMDLVGPFVTTAITWWLAPHNVILYHYVIVIAAFFMLYFGNENQTIVIVSNAFWGLGLSPMLPCMLAFTEMNLALNERDISIYSLLCGITLLATPYFKRTLLKRNARVLFLYVATFIPLSLILFLIAWWWIVRHRRFLPKSKLKLKKFLCFT